MRFERGMLALLCILAFLSSSCSSGDGEGSSPQQTVKRVLAVALSGQGTVRSRPDGIDCGATCQASFDSGTTVALIATPAAGSRFDRWTGACSGMDSCVLTVSSDTQIGANFVTEVQSQPAPQPQPPQPPSPPPAIPPPPSNPPAECAGLMPQNPIGDGTTVSLPTNECHPRGVSDEVNGNFALVHGVDPPYGGSFPAARFFAVHEGRARQIGTTVDGSDMGTFKVWSQPNGFTIFSTDEASAHRDLATYSGPEASLGRIEPITRMEMHSLSSTAVAAIDPSGGTAILRRYPTSVGVTVTYQRYGKAGAPDGTEVPLGTSADLFQVGVSLSGDVLVLIGDPHSALLGRWLTRGGTALTGWFSAPTPSLQRAPFGDDGPAEAFGSELTFLADGSLLLSDKSGAYFIYPDAQPRVDPAPQWLKDRPLATVYLVRGGRGYGVARSAQCNGSFEVLTTAGVSCGCLNGPDLADPQGAPTPNAFVGRDGSLIVQRHAGPECGLGYRLYPGLLR